jgi:hypothetical protein
MNKLILVLILLYSPARALTQTSNLYYLSIGNGYYKSLPDVPNAIISAKVVGTALNKYGKGSVLVPKEDIPLSRDTMIKAIMRTFRSAASDTNAVVFLYYCGHGQNDEKNDNLFFFPGKTDLKDSLLNKSYLANQLLNIRDVQMEFMGKVSEYQPGEDYAKLVIGVMLGYTAYQYEHLQAPFGSYNEKEKKENQTYKDLKDSLLKNFKQRLPRLVIFADCCNDNFNINPEKYKDYKRPSIEDVKNFGDSTSMVITAVGYLLDSVMNTPDYMSDLSGNIARNMYYAFGNKVVYSKNKNVAVQTVPFSNKALNDHIMVGPIAHRLLTYISAKDNHFTTLELLQKLTDPKFDRKIAYCHLETESISLKKKVDPTITDSDIHNLGGKIFKQ